MVPKTVLTVCLATLLGACAAAHPEVGLYRSAPTDSVLDPTEVPASARDPGASLPRIPPGWSVERPSRTTAWTLWQSWWREAELCTGLTGDPEDVEWYVARHLVQVDDGSSCVGLYFDGQIFVHQDHVWTPAVVRHEAIHALRAANGLPIDRTHQSPAFARCEQLSRSW